MQDDYPVITQHTPEIESALLNAKNKSKGVIVVFGADWCPPCRHLDDLLYQPETINKVQPLYEIVKIDIGHWDKNIDTAKMYGNPIRLGIPGMVLLNQDGSIREVIELEKISTFIKNESGLLRTYLLEH